MPNYHAISRERHVRKFWQRCPDFAFAAADAFVPLTAVELANAATALPIGFVKQGEGFIPVAVLSPDVRNCARGRTDDGAKNRGPAFANLWLANPTIAPSFQARRLSRHPVPRTRSHG